MLVPFPIPNLVLGGDFSDYHAFKERSMPYVFFSCGEWEHYHMPTDTVDKLSQDKMARIALYLEAFVRELHDEQGRSDSEGASESPKLPDGLSSGGLLTIDRARFERLEPWFEGRLGSMLNNLGFPQERRP
jgi:hypothetical protein